MFERGAVRFTSGFWGLIGPYVSTPPGQRRKHHNCLYDDAFGCRSESVPRGDIRGSFLESMAVSSVFEWMAGRLGICFLGPVGTSCLFAYMAENRASTLLVY